MVQRCTSSQSFCLDPVCIEYVNVYRLLDFDLLLSVFFDFVVFLTAAYLLRYVVTRSHRDGSAIWSAPLSRYNPWSSFGEEEFVAGSLSRQPTVTDFFEKREIAY